VARSRTVLIAGAGIGGLAAAIALARANFRVVLFERNEQPETSGAGIQLSPNATRALAAIGALDEVKKRAIEPSALIVANGINRAVLANAPLAAAIETQFGAPYLVCLRADLHDALMKVADDHPDIERRFGTTIGDFATHGRGVTALAERARQTEEILGIALIGADGIRSAIRARLHPGAKPTHRRMAAWRATIPASALPDDLHGKQEVRVWLGAHAHLVHYPVGDGSKVNLVAVTPDRHATETWGDVADKNEMMPFFARWNEIPRAVLNEAKEFRRWSLYDLPFLPYWGRGAVTLLGDAAHAMLPFVAQGAAAALEDAVALAKNLENAEETAKALRAYEIERMGRVRRIQDAARFVGRVYHLPAPWWHGRDFVMEKIGGAGLIRRNAWIYRG
jgi:salicylate hydroxylase